MWLDESKVKGKGGIGFTLRQQVGTGSEKDGGRRIKKDKKDDGRIRTRGRRNGEAVVRFFTSRFKNENFQGS